MLVPGEYPPYTYGNADGLTNVSLLEVDQPLALGTIGAVYSANFNNSSNPNGYKTYEQLDVDYSFSITGTPVWTFTGNYQEFDENCTECLSPQLTPNSKAVGSCSIALNASYVIDGLQSTSFSIMVVGPVLVSANDPSTGLHAEHLAIPGGYDSKWYYQIIDSCGSQMTDVNVSEAFPNGLVSAYKGNNWGLTMNTGGGLTNNEGMFLDNITAAHETVPPSLSPQNPLGTTLILYGTQQIYVNPVLVQTFSQAHFQDHGGYN
ncbi:MAG: hypothetical protein ACYCOR_20100 [Acidobacteriaceae bacterium]